MKYTCNDTGKMKEFKLAKSKKNKWVKALRSGKYKQGHGELKTTTAYDKILRDNVKLEQPQFCCLGVARDLRLTIQAKDGVEFVSCSFLPQEIQDTLAKMNDNGESFKTIAAYIEKNL